MLRQAQHEDFCNFLTLSLPADAKAMAGQNSLHVRRSFSEGGSKGEAASATVSALRQFPVPTAAPALTAENGRV